MRALEKIYLYLALGLASVTPAKAVEVQAKFSRVDIDTWQVEYFIENTSLPSLQEFTIFFSFGVASSLSLSQQPIDWDILVAQPDPGLPDGGFIDGLATAGGLNAGQKLGGLIINIETSMPLLDQAQYFEIRDPQDFGLLASGMTSVIAVPEPDSAILWLLGGVAMSIMRFRSAAVTRRSV